MSSVPCYTLMIEDDYKEALKMGETIRSLSHSREDFLNEADFAMYSDYVSSIEYNEDENERLEAAEDIALYLGDFTKVDEHGVIEIPADGTYQFAEKKVQTIKELVKDMTVENFLSFGEYRIRKLVRNSEMLVFPAVYDAKYRGIMGEYIQTFDAFMYHMLKDNPVRLVVIQTTWLHK